jgi:hypothetical protein
VRQLFSSIFDAASAVGVVVLVPAAAINRTPLMIGLAVTAIVLVASRVMIERSKLRVR